MSSPAPVYNETLRSIIDIKLDEIEKQRVAYQELAAGIFTTKNARKIALDDKESLLQRVELLATVVKQWHGAGKLEGTTVGGKLELSNLEFWMKQAREEQGFDLKIIRGWTDTLEAHIRHTSRRFDMAKLSGEMYLECLASGDSKVPYYGGKEAGHGCVPEDGNRDEDFDMMADAPDAKGKPAPSTADQPPSPADCEATLEKEKFVSTVFSEHPINVGKLFAYLDDLFESEETSLALDQVRASNYCFGIHFEGKGITGRQVCDIIRNLLATGLMDEKQRNAVKHIATNAVARKEIVSILNMRMSNLSTWGWPKEGLNATMRRNTSEGFRAFTDPEVVDAILLQHLGLRWSVQLREACKTFFNSKAWKRSPASATQEAAMNKVRLIDQSHDENPFHCPNSINATRENTYGQKFFLSKLNNLGYSDIYNDFVSMVETDKYLGDKSEVSAQRTILHLMATEHRLSRLLHGSHTMVHALVDNFMSSLPHESILIVLAYLGVPQKWITFFQTFLSVPMILQRDTTPRMCKRGMPLGYAFSVFFGEAVMFILDVAINQHAKGLRLYRIHDEMWLWDADVKKCVKAWKAMGEFVAIIGIGFDEKMAGAVYSSPASVDATFLPKGELKWGFLKFDPVTLKFIIDQEEVDLQIAEFRHRLAATKSVLGWVNIYNKYMAHLSRNFGGMPVNCLGSAFIDDLIKTFKRIQEELFRESNLGVVGYLRNRIDECFGVRDLPDGYFYFSTAVGGLQLFNPTLMLSALDKSIASPPIFNNFPVPPSGFMMTASTHTPVVDHTPLEMKLNRNFYSDPSDYEALKSRWEQLDQTWQNKVGVHGAFISFHEYISLRETHLATWGKVYNEMFSTPPAKEVALVQVGMNVGCAHFISKVGRRRPVGVYEKWVESLYGEDVVNTFGRLEIVDQTLILADVDGLFRTIEKIDYD